MTEFGTGPQNLGVKAECRSIRCRNSSTTQERARQAELCRRRIQTVTAIAAGVLKARAGLDMTLVPYKGGVQAVGDLLAGHVDMYSATHPRCCRT